MASADEVLDSLESFAASCNANERLKVMNRDWNRTIHIHPSDLNCNFAVVTRDGAVSVREGKPEAADLLVEAEAEILTQIFYGELPPDEPYNNGILRLQGSAQDVLHLDFITAILWE